MDPTFIFSKEAFRRISSNILEGKVDFISDRFLGQWHENNRTLKQEIYHLKKKNPIQRKGHFS